MSVQVAFKPGSNGKSSIHEAKDCVPVKTNQHSKSIQHLTNSSVRRRFQYHLVDSLIVTATLAANVCFYLTFCGCDKVSEQTVQRLTISFKTNGSPIIEGRQLARFSKAEWQRLVEAKGDLSVLGVRSETNKPVENFDSVWRRF